MADQPRRPRTLNDARTEAEAAFKKTTTKVRGGAAEAGSASRREGAGFAADRSGRARALPGRRTRLAGPDQRGLAQGGGQIGRSIKDSNERRTKKPGVSRAFCWFGIVDRTISAGTRRPTCRRPHRRRRLHRDRRRCCADGARAAALLCLRLRAPRRLFPSPTSLDAVGAVATISVNSALCCSLLR